MRESLGSSFLLSVAAIFIALFVTFLAVSINYTKSFNVKNVIIKQIEEHEGFNRYQLDDIRDAIGGLGYITVNDANRNQYQNACNRYLPGDPSEHESVAYLAGDMAYCVKRICSDKGSYYKVVTFASIEIPIVGLDLKIPISGETKTIYCDINDGNCSRINKGCAIQ